MILQCVLIPSQLSAQSSSASENDTTPERTVRGLLYPRASDLDLGFYGRIEFRGEKSASNRCRGLSPFLSYSGCRSRFEPMIDFQYSAFSKGTVANRLKLDVDYDSQREFDVSNTLSLRYTGGNGEFLQRLEIGNLTFDPPRSYFLAGAFPLGNYGFQAVANLGAGATLRAIIAQQKGHVIRDRSFTIGGGAFQSVDRIVEDYQFEPRRFFFTVDPRQFASYPNIDILNGPQLSQLASSLPDTLRPVRLYVYRLAIGSQPANPSGPQFQILGDPGSKRGQVYEYLREGVDYYADRSLLWISLVRPLSLNNERLVVAYKVRINGVETTHITTGGTPDLEFDPNAPQFANLLWDPRIDPSHPAFFREIRSVYRLGGSEVNTGSVDLQILTGGGEQEHARGPTATNFLSLFRLSKLSNRGEFDVENRIWPKRYTHAIALGADALDQPILRDRFIVFPSLRPFAENGLAGSLNPTNDTLYSIPSEYLYSSQRPTSVYRMRLRYDSEGGEQEGAVMLGAVQLRPYSERVVVDQVTLVRNVDYTIDYDLGRVQFNRPDTLFVNPRPVYIQYEEIPLFVESPTTIFGGILDVPLSSGNLSFMAVSQSEKTPYTRPSLGLEPQSLWLGSVNANMMFNADRISGLLRRLPNSSVINKDSRIRLDAEFAVSKPNYGRKMEAYVESFEGEGGLSVRMDDQYWYYSSHPASGMALPARIGASGLDLARATTLAWQTNVVDTFGRQLRYSIEQIDPRSTLVGAGVAPPEQLLWLTLFPLSVSGHRQLDGSYNWATGATASGRRWRSIRTALGHGSSTGADLTRAEYIEFWTLIKTKSSELATNPTLVFDVGDISENSISFSPDTVILRRGSMGQIDTLFRGRSLAGYDQLDSERDRFSRAFDVAVNDRGLPGDVAENVVLIVDTLPGGAPPLIHEDVRFVTCNNGMRVLYHLGDTRSNCTVGNGRLDEEDLDSDNVLNFTSAERDQESWRRYIVDLSNQANFNRVGSCVSTGAVNPLTNSVDSACWVHVKVPFRSPHDSLNNPHLRRTQALRLTVVSSSGIMDSEFSRIALARLRFSGAPWLKRDDGGLRGLAGESGSGGGFMIAGTVGTQDKDVRSGVDYVSPPGVSDVADSKLPIGTARIQVNERSLRITAGGINQYERAEAYYRFPDGQKSFMGYNQLRLWARGIGSGWGQDGELHFFVKVGRDESNFYMYRTPLGGGNGQAAWLPEIRLDLQRFIALRSAIQMSYLTGQPSASICTGIDSALIANTPLPLGVSTDSRYTACDDGYIVYSIDPAVNAPNLAAVQELAVGLVRVATGTGSFPIAPSDTLELWVNDIRLAGPVNNAGYAGRVALGLVAGNVAEFRTSFIKRDPYFRQLGDQPSFLTNDGVDLSVAVHLDKLLPQSFGYAAPLTVSHTDRSISPLYLEGTDLSGDGIAGLRTPRTAATTVTLGLRRIKPVENSALGAIVNNLSLLSTFTSLQDRSEYTDRKGYNLRFGLAYNLATHVNTGFLSGLATELNMHSGYEKDTDRRSYFYKPARAVDDTASVLRNGENLLRSGFSFSVHPYRNTLFNISLHSLRDLRNYRDVLPPSHYQPMPKERARNMTTELTITPSYKGWLYSRISANSGFSLLRDPNGFELRGDEKHVGNEHSAIFGLTIDPAGYARSSSTLGSIGRSFFNMLHPIDMTVERSLLTTFEAVSSSPDIFYQLGLGGMRDLLLLGNTGATSAGVSTRVSATHGIILPFGVTLTNRFQHTTLRNWVKHLDNRLDAGDATQTSFPDVGLRWGVRPVGSEAAIRQLNTSIRWVGTRQLLSAPGEYTPTSGNNGRVNINSFPVSVSATWAGDRPMTTSVGATYSRRKDRRPGISGRGDALDLNAEISRAFAVPASWPTQGDVRTRLAYFNANGRNFVVNPMSSIFESRLMDNGRRSVTLTADTDVAENMSSSFVISRVASFDRNFNRKFTQTVLSAILHIQFFGGEKR